MRAMRAGMTTLCAVCSCSTVQGHGIPPSSWTAGQAAEPASSPASGKVHPVFITALAAALQAWTPGRWLSPGRREGAGRSGGGGGAGPRRERSGAWGKPGRDPRRGSVQVLRPEEFREQVWEDPPGAAGTSLPFRACDNGERGPGHRSLVRRVKPVCKARG